ncbi:SAM-dependent methyltransferase [Bacteroidia bacterium]|nr:SAM-dependent methyltransferase [Bacteroidia bacterium]
MSLKKVYLYPKKEESLLRYHPWLFSGAIQRIEGTPEEGEIVEIYTAGNNFLAVGHCQIGSIAVRILSFENEPINHDFWKKRLQAAYELRRQLGLVNCHCGLDPQFPKAKCHCGLDPQSLPNNIYRLVHGEGDNLSGLIIDIYANTAVMQAHTPGMHLAHKEIAEALKEVMGDAIDTIYYKSADTLPFKAELDVEDGYLLVGQGIAGQARNDVLSSAIAGQARNDVLSSAIAGQARNDVSPSAIQARDSILSSAIAVENGLKFKMDWEKGQKTGFFVDQRDNRSLLEKYAKDRSVLNMFCYTGGFSCYAMRGGAKLVHSVDSSGRALALTNANIALNFPNDLRHKSFDTDAFKYLDEMGDQYDLIVLDPPAFAKHKKVLRNALQGYRKLNALAFEKIKPGGIIFTFSCSQVVSKQDFRLTVFSAAAQSGRKIKILHQLAQPADHPINIYHPEGEYLKGLILAVE